MNYNRFLTTVLLIPMIIFPSYYCQLRVQVDMWQDPYNNEVNLSLEESGQVAEF